ncbi:hypothetical protein F5Y01DRAFT_46285 [Xylaria sp. FL0043]|nr:hypothetical protein F5Y01DRAFT_46285 [Xylaria sp. FL0043]
MPSMKRPSAVRASSSYGNMAKLLVDDIATLLLSLPVSTSDSTQICNIVDLRIDAPDGNHTIIVREMSIHEYLSHFHLEMSCLLAPSHLAVQGFWADVTSWDLLANSGPNHSNKMIWIFSKRNFPAETFPSHNSMPASTSCVDKSAAIIGKFTALSLHSRSNSCWMMYLKSMYYLIFSFMMYQIYHQDL